MEPRPRRQVVRQLVDLQRRRRDARHRVRRHWVRRNGFAMALAVVTVTAGAAPACGTDTDTDTDTGTEARADELFPDIVAVAATTSDDGTWTFDVTVSSPYDTPDRYADGWRVVGPDGTVYGVHTLGHDHANEQPFTRRQRGVSIPATVATVTIEGRDQVSGFGGATVEVDLDAVRAAS